MSEEFSHLIERGLTQESVYRGTLLKVRVDTVALPNGEIATREIVDHPGAVAIVALTDTNEVLLVRQFRYPIGRLTLELPAGRLEWGETPEEAARRELAEEVYKEAGQWEVLGETVLAPGYSNERMTLFRASSLLAAQGQRDADEFLDVVTMPLDKAIAKVRRGEIQDAKTIIGLLMAAQG